MNLNRDQAEIDKFGQWADEWWNPQGKLKTLHEINPLRLAYIQQRTPLAGLKILDIGCGGGILSESLAKAGAAVTGIDLSPEAIKVAKTHAEENTLNIDYQLISAEQFADLHSAEFDIVTCLELLEHVPDPKAIIAAAANCVKIGGQLFFATLNRNPKAFLHAIVGAEYLLRLLPKQTHDYAKFIKPSELTAWARTANCELKDLTGFQYHLINKNYYLSDDVSVNYLAQFEKTV